MAEQREIVGFVGLGAMGGPMAANLVRGGYRVAGFDVAEQRRSEAAAAGVELTASVAEVAGQATRTLVSIVRDADQTRELVHGPEGLLASRREGLTLICMSTLDPTALLELSQDLAAHGIEVVDAPVSGGVTGAREATLTVILAGPEAAIERVRPILERVGKNLFSVGARPGMAQAAKLANQLMLAVDMLGIAEGLQLASRHDVDEKQLMELLSVSTGGSWAVRNWQDVRDFWRSAEPGGTLEIILKDLRSIFREADRQRLSLPVTAVANQRIRHTWGEG
ncbi:MAG: NAD(P)-dependent oxidoreductase [Candidatus Dormibacteraceae bacterium]